MKKIRIINKLGKEQSPKSIQRIEHQNSEIMNERTKMRGAASSTKF